MNTPSIDPDKLARTLHKPERKVMKTEREEYVGIGIEKELKLEKENEPEKRNWEEERQY